MLEEGPYTPHFGSGRPVFLERKNRRWSLAAGATWWAESGSIRWAYEHDYLRNILNYVNGQRATREAG